MLSGRAKMVFLLGALFLFYLLPYIVSRQPLSPDELDFDYFSSLLAREGAISFSPRGDAIFGFRGFVPRDFAYNCRGEAVPWGPPGFIVLAALVKSAFSELGAVALNPALGVLAVYLFYRLCCSVLKDRGLAFGAALLLGTMPAFIHFDNFFVADVLSVAVFLGACCSLVGVAQRGRFPHYLLFGVFCGLLVWIRYTNLVLILPLLVYLFAGRKGIRLFPLLMSLALACVIAGVFFVYCNKLYGNYFAIGYSSEKIVEQVPGAVGGSSAIGKLLSWYRFRPWEIFRHLIYIPVSFSIAFPPFILAVLTVFRDVKHRRGGAFYLSYLVLFLLLLLLFGNYRVYGFEERHMTLQSSFLRYFLPFLVFMPLLAVKFLGAVGGGRGAAVFIVAALNFLVAVFGPFGVADTIGGRVYFSRVARFIINSTPVKSVLLTSYWGKEVFPERMVFSRTAKLRPEEMDRVVGAVAEKGYIPYYVDHRNDKRLLRHLKRNYDLEEISGPCNLPWFMRKGVLPRDLYPVKVFRIGSFEERVMPPVGRGGIFY